MEIRVARNEHGHLLIEGSLKIRDVDTGEEMELKGAVTEMSPLTLLTDAGSSRSAAAVITGRMITRWKMALIDSLDSGILEAVTAHLRQELAGPEADGEPRDGGTGD